MVLLLVAAVIAIVALSAYCFTLYLAGGAMAYWISKSGHTLPTEEELRECAKCFIKERFKIK